MTVSHDLARLAIDLRGLILSPKLATAIDDAIVDWFGAALSGSDSTASRAIAAGMSPLSGNSRIVGTPDTAPSSIAALINGIAAHAREVDDIYAPGLFHPGAPVIAAALAVAEQRNSSMADFKTAVMVGYELGCRVARDLGPAHYARWHTTGTAGSVAASAAVSTLLDLSAEQVANALSLAATMSAGLQQTFRSDAMGKPLHSGNAAHAGVVAAIAAAGGVTGAPDVFEGSAGLAAATRTPTLWTHSTPAVGTTLAIEEITVKPFPCCGHTFAPIDAALRIRADRVDIGDISRVEVETYTTAIAVAGNPCPRTPHERRFSIPFVVARALADERIGESSFITSSPGVETLLPRIAMSTDGAFERDFPERRGARVIVTMSDGRCHEAVVPDRPGSPQNPMTAEAIGAKFLELAAPVLGQRVDDALSRLRGGAAFVGELLVI